MAGPATMSESAHNTRAFDTWAQTYDSAANPLLVLEQRTMEPLLPNPCGRDVLDAGCGSGRWLGFLAGQKPRRLCGLDASAGMLDAARRRGLANTRLLQGSCTATPFAAESFDLILGSFVLSYLDDVHAFATEMNRIARGGCDLFLSDMHPETQKLLGWKRVFHEDGKSISLNTAMHRIEEIVAAFICLGWEADATIEPAFGAAEREVFAAAGRLKRFHEAQGHPAIYIMHLRKPERDRKQTRQETEIVLCGMRCAFGPEESTAASLQIHNGRIAQIQLTSEASFPANSRELDLSGYLLLPGLVNAHDHLEFALFPRLASPPYPNATLWARDIHERYAELIAMHRSIPKEVRLWWGGLRNLLCGVTTVCHHNAAEPVLLRDDFPVRVARGFGWSHSLAFGRDLRADHAATPLGSPFMVHAAEGIDTEAYNEIAELERLGILGSNTVLIHGLAVNEQAVGLLRRRRTALILCPSSNDFLFGHVPQMDLLREIESIALGSDSPLTATGDLLDEVRFALAACRIEPRAAWSMVTETPAAMLRLEDGEGSMRVCGAADLIAIRDTGMDAVHRLATLSAGDVEFVMVGGRVQLASAVIFDRLPSSVREGLEPLRVDGNIRWLRAPVRELLGQAEEVLGAGHVRLGGKSVAAEAHHVH